MGAIDKNSRLPLYFQLMDLIIDRIKIGELKPQDRLQSERELCETYNVSRATVRQALNELIKDGYVYTEHGKGTYVSEQRIKQELLKFYSFSEEMRKINKVPTSNVLDFEVVNPDINVARTMGIKENDEVYKVLRLRLADDEPMMVETTYLPCSVFQNLTKDMLTEKSMYEVLTKKYGVKFTRAEECFMAAALNPFEAKLLGVKEKQPSMTIERLTYENTRVVEYTKSIARGDRFKFVVKLNS